eukprot:tig00021127_g18775.t1
MPTASDLSSSEAGLSEAGPSSAGLGSSAPKPAPTSSAVVPAVDRSSAPEYAVDMRSLFVEYERRKDNSFDGFKEAWKALNFSTIFRGRPPDMEDREYVRALASLCFGYLGQALHLRCGVVYALYLLYSTQPYKPKMRIGLSIDLWKDLRKIQEEARAAGAPDAADLVDTMIHGVRAFSLCAAIHVNTAAADMHLSRAARDAMTAQRAMEEVPPEAKRTDRLKGLLDLESLERINGEYMQLRELVAVARPSLPPEAVVPFVQSHNTARQTAALALSNSEFVKELGEARELHELAGAAARHKLPKPPAASSSTTPAPAPKRRPARPRAPAPPLAQASAAAAEARASPAPGRRAGASYASGAEEEELEDVPDLFALAGRLPLAAPAPAPGPDPGPAP